MERITLPSPEPLVMLLPAPVEEVLRLPAVEPLTLQLPAPAENVLTLPMPEPLRIVLPASMIPRVPGLAAGSVEGTASITGNAVARARAAGWVQADAVIFAGLVARARAQAAGAIAAAVTITGDTRVFAAGAVTATASITGKAVARLSGAVTAAASIVGTAKRVLSGGVTGTGSVAGSAAARAAATGGITATTSIAGTAILPAYPMGMDKVGTQVIPGASSGAWSNAVKIVDWAARSGYPSTTIVNDCLVAGAAMTVTYSAKVTYQTGGVGSLVQFHLAKNETELVASANTGGTITGTISLNPGDTLSLWGAGNSGIGNGYRTVLAGATNTYLYWTVN